MFEKEMVCSSCGTKGKPRVTNRGSLILCLFLFLCFVVPGVFYLFYMLTGHKNCCKQCKAETMIPLDSPMAKKLLAD